MGRVALAAALMVPLAAAPVEAQSWRWDIGVNGGMSWFSAMLGSEDTGLPDGYLRDDVRFEAGPRVGAQLGFWFNPKLGLRFNGTYSDRDVVDKSWDAESEHFDNVNLWTGTADLLFRLRQPSESWMGRETLPYFALGLGAKWHNPAGDNFTCRDVEEDKTWACFPFTPNGTGNNFAMGEQKVLSALLGLGADFRMSPGFAIRLELNDRIYKPQLYLANATIGAGNVVTLTNGDENVSKWVHEIGLDLGLHLLMGLAAPPVVTVAEPPRPVAPPPPPVTTPPPPTPTPPATESVTVCVVDPTAPGGLRMQTMTYRIAQRDTVINGQPYRQAIGNVMTVRNADWYVRGQPLTLTVGTNKMELTTYQGAVQIESNRLSYLGTINGYPVYADRDEVADVIDRINDVRRAQQNNADLSRILAERRDIRDELEDIKYFYVPLEPAGCIFQPLQMLEQVRKGKQ